jgi:hypothetical protein
MTRFRVACRCELVLFFVERIGEPSFAGYASTFARSIRARPFRTAHPPATCLALHRRAGAMIVGAAGAIRCRLGRVCRAALDWLAGAVLVPVLVGSLVVVLALPRLLVFLLVMAWTLWCDGD